MGELNYEIERVFRKSDVRVTFANEGAAGAEFRVAMTDDVSNQPVSNNDEKLSPSWSWSVSATGNITIKDVTYGRKIFYLQKITSGASPTITTSIVRFNVTNPMYDFWEFWLTFSIMVVFWIVLLALGFVGAVYTQQSDESQIRKIVCWVLAIVGSLPIPPLPILQAVPISIGFTVAR
tara:strand:+ start:808 stop:1341 length:534 start_codon:yes stop_codon:yes gene_type:complete